MTELAEYYAARAKEYDRIYQKPERQEDLERLRLILCELLAGFNVLEVACGTGYWTQFIAPVARKVVALDINEEVLEIAKIRLVNFDCIRFLKEDAFGLENVGNSHTAAFSGFWWSHLEKSRLPQFLETIHSKLEPGAMVVFTDNCYVERSSTPLSRTDEEGNTYQLRKLENGKEYEILKNFPDALELGHVLGPYTSDLTIQFLQYFWYASYRL